MYIILSFIRLHKLVVFNLLYRNITLFWKCHLTVVRIYHKHVLICFKCCPYLFFLSKILKFFC
jgi:hypothetical protein